jgi:putative ABC transport system ATP-binding protein
MEVIKIENLYKSYVLGETKIEALKGVNLTLESGEFTALIGASGSGKSTLLNLLGCLDTADAGKIFIQGIDISLLKEHELDTLRNSRLGYIFQSFNLIPVLSVFENTELPLLVQRNISQEERKERVLSALADVGLEKFVDHLPDKLSGGQRQRAAIARCLVTRPSFILADEPTANLDSVTAHLVIDLLKDLNQKKGVTFLFCTHDEKLIGRVSRIVNIQDGLIK